MHFTVHVQFHNWSESPAQNETEIGKVQNFHVSPQPQVPYDKRIL